MERQSVEVWFGGERDYFSLGGQQRREKNNVERDREKWRHKSLLRQKHGLPAEADVDIVIVHGAASVASVTGGLAHKWLQAAETPLNGVGMQ